MIIDNAKMLACFDAADREKYYHTCMDIAFAGGDYKARRIVFFAKHPEDPLSEYIQVKLYSDQFLLLHVNTEDAGLLAECLAYVDNIRSEFAETELRTPFSSVFRHAGLNARFSVHMPAYPANPSYYIHSPAELTAVRHSSAVHTAKLTEADKIEIAQGVKTGNLDAEYMGENMFHPITRFNDVLWYILRVNREIAGYLRAECSYANIYDIGFLYVEKRYRGNGYAAELVSRFSRDIFSQGAIPHYGYAISRESARVAEKCGYQCDRTPLICRMLMAK